MPRVVSIVALSILTMLPSLVRAEDQKWGTLKGRVVFDGDPPARKKIDPAIVDRNVDKAFCTKNGDILSDALVVDPKTKGVRWVMVWLMDEKGGGKLPIHPTLKKAAEKVEIDQPCCMFEPHVLGIRAGQVLVAKNSAMVAHNVNILGVDGNPEKNIVIPAGKSLEVEGWVASPRMMQIQCTFHTWMNCWVHVFEHPYFAVTNEKGEFEIKNAPAGNFRMVVWQESAGWVVMEPPDFGKKGVPVTIKADAVTDFGDVKLKPPKD